MGLPVAPNLSMSTVNCWGPKYIPKLLSWDTNLIIYLSSVWTVNSCGSASLKQGEEKICCYNFIKQSSVSLKQKPYFIFMLEHKEVLHPKASTPQTQTVYFKQEILSLTEELHFTQTTPILSPSCVFSKIRVFIKELNQRKEKKNIGFYTFTVPVRIINLRSLGGLSFSCLVGFSCFFFLLFFFGWWWSFWGVCVLCFGFVFFFFSFFPQIPLYLFAV